MWFFDGADGQETELPRASLGVKGVIFLEVDHVIKSYDKSAGTFQDQAFL